VVLTTSYLVPFRNEVTRERNMDDVNLVARHAQTIRLTFALVLRWSLLRVVRDLKGVRAKRPRANNGAAKPHNKTASKTTTRRGFSPLTVFVVYVT